MVRANQRSPATGPVRVVAYSSFQATAPQSLRTHHVRVVQQVWLERRGERTMAVCRKSWFEPASSEAGPGRPDGRPRSWSAAPGGGAQFASVGRLRLRDAGRCGRGRGHGRCRSKTTVHFPPSRSTR